MNIVEIYTDGACIRNPGPGGWGAILRYNAVEKELSGFDPDTTNNRMELTAAIMGLKALKWPCRVVLYTDSQYLQLGISQWIRSWKRRGWSRKRGSGEIKNRDLWMQLDELASIHKVSWKWVKGHNGNIGNERADKLAGSAARLGYRAHQLKTPAQIQSGLRSLPSRE
jgi:ribonuclease HI